MQKKYDRRSAADERRYRRGWKRITVLLSLIVVIATFSSLMLPAITLNKETCERVEHKHTENCYSPTEPLALGCDLESLGIHQHEAECYNETGLLICDKVDFVVHKHDAYCLDENGQMICTLPEVEEHTHDNTCWVLTEADPGHIHDDFACYDWANSDIPICGQIQAEGHDAHTEDCYQYIRGDAPRCGLEEGVDGHSHVDDCYELVKTDTLVCTRHIHTEDCYAKEKGALICTETERLATDATIGLACDKPEVALHTHGEECYITEAELDENTEPWIFEMIRLEKEAAAAGAEEADAADEAEDAAQTEEKKYLICKLPEVLQHQHDETCFTGGEVKLICEIPEHTHTSKCAAEAVIELVKALPDVDTFQAEYAAMTEEAGAAYVQSLLAQVEEIQTAYDALSQENQQEVWNIGKLTVLEPVLRELAPETEPAETETEATEATEATEETVVSGNSEAITPSRKVLTYEGSDYTLTVSYGDEAMLPDNVELSVKEILPDTGEYEQYYDQTVQAVDSDNIVYVRLFDIKFLSDGVEAEPAAPVQVDVRRVQPQETDGTVKAQMVHFGEDGATLLETETEEDGQGITGTVYMQEEFAVPVQSKARMGTRSAGDQTQDTPTAYVEYIENEDHGPNKLLVDWYVFLDKEWTKVGSTRTGWQGSVSGENYDYISEGQAKYVLGQYGFTGGRDGCNDLAYRMIQNQGAEPTFKQGIFDLTDGTDGDGNHYYRLAKDSQTDAYGVFFIPNTAESVNDSNGTQYTVYEQYGDGIGVYSVRVYDPQNAVYDATESLPIGYVVHGRTLSLDLKKIDGKAAENNFGWCLHRPSLMEIGEIGEGTNSTIAEKDADTCTITLNSVTQAIYIAAHDELHENDQVLLNVPPDDLTVNYFIYIDGVWERVGTTHTGWTISGRRAANADTYDDPNYLYDGCNPANPNHSHTDEISNKFAADDKGYERDIISMSQVENILGRYGFTPSVKTPFSIEKQGGSAKNDTYRIKDLGYQKLKLDEATGKLVPENGTIYFDTYYDGRGSLLFYPLSQSNTKDANGKAQSCAGYNVYYVPHGSNAGSVAGDDTQTALDKLASLSTVGRKDVEYYVYLNGSWTKVGTSHYYNPAVSDTDRDTIGIHQMYEFLEPYGFPETGPTDSKELFYVDSTGKCKNDTTIANGQYSLAQKSSRPSGAYKVYWMPGTTTSQSNAATPVVVTDGQFYLFQVYEPSNSVYDSMELCPKVYVRHGQTGTLEVKNVNIEDGVNQSDWMVKGLDRNETLMAAGADSATITNANGSESEISRVLNEKTGLWTYTFTNMQQTAIIAFPYANGDRSLSNNYADASVVPSLSGLVEDPNIRFTMHNYSTKINEYLRSIGLASFGDSNTGTETEVNASGLTGYKEQNTNQTYFSFRGAGGNQVTYSTYLDNDPFQKNHATVKRNLADGYPVLDVTHHGYTTADKLKQVGFTDADITSWKEQVSKPTSLAFLFGGGGAKDTGDDGVTEIADGNTTYVLNYMNNVNTPLQILNGKYQYFSYFNAADFNTNEQKWYVRNYVERTEETATSYITKDDYGDFLPFNHSGGELIPGRAYNYYQEDVDYWYGMTMRAKFYMSEGGSTDAGPMIFSFAGDDDVYVFVDGKLVLDVGGTHGSCTGFINFQTGLVAAYYDFNAVSAGNITLKGTTVDSLQTDPYDNSTYRRYYSTTIYEAYKAAMEEAGMSDADIDAKLKELFEPVLDADGNQLTVSDYWASEGRTGGKTYPQYRFKDYSMHDLDYFYMERGSSVANCNIQFNLATLPEENLTISKALDYKTNDVTDVDKEFYTTAEKHSFRIVSSEGEPLTSSKGYTYPVTTADGQSAGTVTADSNGIFQISAGQRVTVKDINAWLEKDKLESYIVQELIPADHALAKTPVNINGVEQQAGAEVKIAGVTYIPYDFTAHAGEGSNSVVFTPYTNQRDLSNAGYLALRKDVGTASAGDTEFSVKVSVNGVPVPEGTRFYPCDQNGNISDENDWARADANGVVKIKADTTYRLGAKLIPGYTYTVEEVNIPIGWGFDHYTKTVGSAAEGEAVTAGSISGTITANTLDTVTVYNKTVAINLDIPLVKQFVGMDKGDAKSRSAVFTAEQVVWDGASNQYVRDAKALITPDPTVTIDCTGSAANKGAIQLAYPENTQNDTYFYRVKETGMTPQAGETFFKDTSEYIVKVVIETPTGESAQTAKITAIYRNGELISGTDDEQTIENGPTSLVFVNQRGGVSLPDTGGVGTIPYMFSGFAMVVIALALMYSTQRKQRKGGKP